MTQIVTALTQCIKKCIMNSPTCTLAIMEALSNNSVTSSPGPTSQVSLGPDLQVQYQQQACATNPRLQISREPTLLAALAHVRQWPFTARYSPQHWLTVMVIYVAIPTADFDFSRMDLFCAPV